MLWDHLVSSNIINLPCIMDYSTACTRNSMIQRRGNIQLAARGVHAVASAGACANASAPNASVATFREAVRGQLVLAPLTTSHWLMESIFGTPSALSVGSTPAKKLKVEYLARVRNGDL